MSKMRYFSNEFLNLQFCDLKFRDLAKLWFFKLIMTKLNVKNGYDVISVTSSPLRQRKNITKITSQFFPICPPQLKFLATPVAWFI